MRSDSSIDEYPNATFDFLLTTFPGHKSRNVGDNLISTSSMQLMRSRDPSFAPRLLFREASLDDYPHQRIRRILAPGFSVANGVYPEIFALYRDLKRLPPFFPMGCSFQNPIPSLKIFKEYIYSKETIDFLKFIVQRSGPLPCRDELIVDMLHRYDIAAVYSGDMAIYDENKIYKEFRPVSAIRSVVLTIQHSSRYDDQCFNLIKLIRRKFNDSILYVAFHSVPTLNSRRIANYGVKHGFRVLHLYGDVKNLDVYDDIDLHIGYRLHGHISFLRRRKPSILMVEDARSYGFAKTVGTSLGCIEALSLDDFTADVSAAERAMSFIEGQVLSKFSDYQSVFSSIDRTYREFVSPFFDGLAKSA